MQTASDQWLEQNGMMFALQQRHGMYGALERTRLSAITVVAPESFPGSQAALECTCAFVCDSMGGAIRVRKSQTLLLTPRDRDLSYL